MKSRNKKKISEAVPHMIFLICGLVAVTFVLCISVYLVVSGIPAIREIGLIHFLGGTKWASTAKNPKFGILPFILTSVYGTAGAVLIGVPVGLLTAVYLSKFAKPKVAGIIRMAVQLLYSVCGLRPGGHDRAGSGNPARIPPVLRRHAAGGDHRSGDYDSAFHRQCVGYGAPGGAEGV